MRFKSRPGELPEARAARWASEEIKENEFDQTVSKLVKIIQNRDNTTAGAEALGFCHAWIVIMFGYLSETNRIHAAEQFKTRYTKLDQEAILAKLEENLD